MNNVTIAGQNDLEQLLEIYVKASRQNHEFLGETNIQIAKDLVRDVYFVMSTSLKRTIKLSLFNHLSITNSCFIC